MSGDTLDKIVADKHRPAVLLAQEECVALRRERVTLD